LPTHHSSTLVRPSIDSRPRRPQLKFIRKPSRLTLVVAGFTVLAAALAGSVVTFWPSAGTARQTASVVPAKNPAMAAATVQQIARLRAHRDYLTDQHATVLGMAAPAPFVQAPKPKPTQAAPVHATQPQPATPAAAGPVPSGSAQQIAMAMLASYGWSSSQFSCLDPLWQRESGWNVYAANPDGAYGIPQALPGSKMASAGPDWQSNAATQIKWGLSYIQSRYGSPCAAWAHSQTTGWY
jgi:hypothetical protein